MSQQQQEQQQHQQFALLLTSFLFDNHSTFRLPKTELRSICHSWSRRCTGSCLLTDNSAFCSILHRIQPARSSNRETSQWNTKQCLRFVFLFRLFTLDVFSWFGGCTCVLVGCLNLSELGVWSAFVDSRKRFRCLLLHPADKEWSERWWTTPRGDTQSRHRTAVSVIPMPDFSVIYRVH